MEVAVEIVAQNYRLIQFICERTTNFPGIDGIRGREKRKNVMFGFTERISFHFHDQIE